MSFDESKVARGGNPANPGEFSAKDAGRASAGQVDDAFEQPSLAVQLPAGSKVAAVAVVGSTAYGLSHEGSDTDRLGVFVMPTESFLGLYGPAPSELSQHLAISGGDDITMHEVGKYAQLALKANPSASELLWVESYEDSSDEFDELRAHRDRLLGSHQVRSSYLGYANSQLAGAERGKNEAGREKFGRHLYRVLHQGVSLHRTGRLELKVPSREDAFEMGRVTATGDLEPARRLMAWAEGQFELSTPLRDEPDMAWANDWLVRVRTAHLRG